jgi:predicted DNA-binding transcriptional regulator YafY
MPIPQQDLPASSRPYLTPESHEDREQPRRGSIVDQALLGRRVLRMEYGEGDGTVTTCEVETTICLGGESGHWYLVV